MPAAVPFCPPCSTMFLAFGLFFFFFDLVSPETEGGPVECRDVTRDNGAELEAEGTKVEAPGSSCANPEPPLVVKPSKAVVIAATAPLLPIPGAFNPFLFGVRVRGIRPPPLPLAPLEPCGSPFSPLATADDDDSGTTGSKVRG